MNLWDEFELGKVASYGKEKVDAQFLDASNYISTDNMLQNKEGVISSDYVPIDGRHSKYVKNDILVSNIRPYFKKIWFANKNGGCSNDVIVFKVNQNIADPRFLYYQLSKDEFFDFMMAGANGTKMPRGNKDSIPNFKLLLPPLPTQRRIASILSAYDDLIENNLKRIKLLEELAQRTYEEWFVKFRINDEPLPIDEKTGLPVGWEIKRADELFNIKIGKTPPRDQEEWFCKSGEGVKWASIKDINNSNIFISETSEGITEYGVDKFNMNVAKLGTVILSFKLTVGKVVILSENMTTNEAIAHFNELENISPCNTYTYCYLRTFNYDKLGSTSSIGTALNSKIVKAMPFLVPEMKIISRFETEFKPVFDQINNLIKQNHHLKTSRDILLPRLMSGKINVE